MHTVKLIHIKAEAMKYSFILIELLSNANSQLRLRIELARSDMRTSCVKPYIILSRTIWTIPYEDHKHIHAFNNVSLLSDVFRMTILFLFLNVMRTTLEFEYNLSFYGMVKRHLIIDGWCLRFHCCVAVDHVSLENSSYSLVLLVWLLEVYLTSS